MSDWRDFYTFDPAQTDALLGWARRRIEHGSDPAQGARSPAALAAAIGPTLSAEGIGWRRAFAHFADTIVPATRPFDHPTSLSFVASAPSCAALGMDAALSAAAIFAGNWDGGAGAIYAENQALAWLAALAGWPESAGGVFVAGGTLGNLSALHAARERCQARRPRPPRWALIASAEAHSSIAAAARVMDAELLLAAVDDSGRMCPRALAALLEQHAARVFAVVASGGATNCGAVDPLAEIADQCAAHALWLHVDGAYGAAALASRERPRFDGIERADSFIVDPHKWLFAPYDCCALLYREPQWGAHAHGQRAAYLDTLDQQAWNPADFAIHLSRRARGLPLWFSLAVHGTAAYRAAIDRVLDLSAEIAAGIAAMEHLELLLGPRLSVILFKAPALDGAAMARWAEAQRRSGALLCLPTRWRGEPVFRLCLVNPGTDVGHVLRVLATLARA